MWRGILRILSSLAFGLAAFIATMPLMVFLEFPPASQEFPVDHSAQEILPALIGILVFLGLLLRDLARGLYRER
jgi:hypothetical protein